MRKRLMFVAAFAVAALTVSAGSAMAATTVIVQPGTTSWTQDDTRGGGQVGWTSALGAPAGYGTSSLELSTTASTADKAGLYNHSMAGMPLSQVTSLSYATYQQAAASFPSGGDASYQLQIDVDGTLGGTGFTTLVYEPYNGSPANGIVVPQTWQSWSVAAGQFWSSRSTTDLGTGSLTAGGGGAPFYTLADVKAKYPSAVVVGIGVNIGSNNPSYDIGVDAIQLNDTTYDFVAGCATTTSGSTITLQGDCMETSPFAVPAGFTFDGAGYTLTMADPSSAQAFVGAGVQNTLGSDMNVRNLHLLGASQIVDCNTYTGIQFTNGGGAVTQTTIDNLLRGSYTGCQNGLGVLVDNQASSASKAVMIDHTTVTRYNKNGITVKGRASATITNNTVTGAGPLGLGYAAQNGIQISYGASALIGGNSVSGNNYTPQSYVACGLLYYQAGGIKQQSNNLFNNERDVCNFGKGGGNVSP